MGQMSMVRRKPPTAHAMRKPTIYARIILELLQDGDESEAEENADGEDGTEDKNVCHTLNIRGYRLKSREERLILLHIHHRVDNRSEHQSRQPSFERVGDAQPEKGIEGPNG
jgi:hypothetical protein